jgi:hypothetical protein
MRGWRGLREVCGQGACFFRIGRECCVGDDELGSHLSDKPVT